MIYHVAPYADNAGDIVIVDACQKLFREIDKDITRVEDWKEQAIDYNKARAVFVGGGGMFIPDTKPNKTSGWRWNITTRQMSKIKVPLIGYAIGFNKFRDQDDFHPNFKASLNNMIRQASFFGMREKSGIDRLIRYTHYTDMIAWQPCPAQFGKMLYPHIGPTVKQPYLVFAPAMDRPHLRGDISAIIPALRYAVLLGWKLKIAAHIAADKEIITMLDDIDYKFVDLRGKPADEIMQFYANAGCVIGMRLHSLLIPFGMGIPIIPVISHDKITDWLSDINQPDWGVELRDPGLNQRLMFRIDNFKLHTDLEARSMMWKVTKWNMEYIKAVIDG